MSEEQQLWQYIVDGTQLGPVTADQLQHLAASGDITPETYLWTEGLDDWIPATQVEGLFPEPAAQPHRPQLITGSAPGHGVQSAHPVQAVQPAAHPVQPAQPQVMPYVAPTVPGAAPVAGAVPGAVGGAMPPAAMMGAAQPGTEYPPLTVKRASYGLLLWMFLGAIGCLIGFFVTAASAANAAEKSGSAAESVGGGAAILALLLYLGALVLLLVYMILSLVYLHRAWSCLRYGGPQTTPGKAVGFLFIPFFNIYWVFIAYLGLAKDWNRIMQSYPNLQAGPRMNEGMFIAYLVCMFVFWPIGPIMQLVVFSEICKGINFMASRHLLPQAGGLGQPATGGGIRLY